MDELRDIEYRPVAVTPTFLLWLMFSVVVAGTAVLVFGLPAGPPPLVTPAVSASWLGTPSSSAGSSPWRKTTIPLAAVSR